ncbi:NAD-dependent epimerase/dehydratase family protein [Pullulanibacillus sp. KACC 23026]|uniref:NAD-dependent epimerase/dehydratase family protein n=1 Tax=Pullulanibacillus sp. KACC 23026 TaxID=3028315 RepID=UPI0023B1DE02|nr:NAD-dependent epimerase/dehydratase family protein [Pullulanibacillus sp. KACC 23026]WEG14885.1 NAD-dependent epimerase/dehydratase family protein [Pullulanibacillus sp. KACC 23026]
MVIKDINLNKTYFVTGAAGFIGYYLAVNLLKIGCNVIGIDNLNEYYDIKLKISRLEKLKSYEKFTFVKGDLIDKVLITDLFNKYKPNIVINLAAQAGVRYSIENPDVYIQSNIIGFYNILEACRYFKVDHLIYASSSSVYGANKKVPFEESDFVDNPVSLYAATKKSNELMAHSYSHLYNIPTTGLRFFTVYGPMGRPDMAYFSFANKYFSGEPIRIFNNGDFENDLYRDFTYIDDIIEGISRLLNNPPSTPIPHRVFNIGNNKPEKLMNFISTLENAFSNTLGREIIFEKVFEPLKAGDVPATYASIDLLHNEFSFKPSTTIKEGLQKFADWYANFYNIK